MINWMYYPKNMHVDKISEKIINIFVKLEPQITSKSYTYSSNEVLSVLEPDLSLNGFCVEKGKKSQYKIHVPVLFGLNGKIEKAFDADAYSLEDKYVIEVEAGRAVINYQFLKDFFEACTMFDVDRLCIAVRNKYRNTNDFEKVCLFFDALYQSGRIGVPLKGMLIVGY